MLPSLRNEMLRKWQSKDRHLPGRGSDDLVSLGLGEGCYCSTKDDCKHENHKYWVSACGNGSCNGEPIEKPHGKDKQCKHDSWDDECHAGCNLQFCCETSNGCTGLRFSDESPNQFVSRDEYCQTGYVEKGEWKANFVAKEILGITSSMPISTVLLKVVEGLTTVSL